MQTIEFSPVYWAETPVIVSPLFERVREHALGQGIPIVFREDTHSDGSLEIKHLEDGGHSLSIVLDPRTRNPSAVVLHELGHARDLRGPGRELYERLFQEPSILLSFGFVSELRIEIENRAWDLAEQIARELGLFDALEPTWGPLRRWCLRSYEVSSGPLTGLGPYTGPNEL